MLSLEDALVPSAPPVVDESELEGPPLPAVCPALSGDPELDCVPALPKPFLPSAPFEPPRPVEATPESEPDPPAPESVPAVPPGFAPESPAESEPEVEDVEAALGAASEALGPLSPPLAPELPLFEALVEDADANFEATSESEAIALLVVAPASEELVLASLLVEVLVTDAAVDFAELLVIEVLVTSGAGVREALGRELDVSGGRCAAGL